MFKLDDIQFSYPKGTPIHFPSVSFDKGEKWLILGSSGCGKTTLLHLMAGLIVPQQGSIKLDETEMTNLSKSQMDKFRGSNIGVVFQQPHFLSSLDLVGNLLVSQSLAGKKKDKKQIKELLIRVGLTDRMKARPHQLSVGEQQRAGIARAVVNNPKIILADEPTSALDDENTNIVLDLLNEEADINNATLIIVTHDTRLKERIDNKIEL